MNLYILYDLSIISFSLYLILYILLKRYFFKITFLYTFLGTIAHELMHFTLGLLFFAKPIFFSLIPKKSNSGGYTLGSVSFNNINFINALPVSLAPLLLIPISLYLLFLSIGSDTYYIKFIFSYLAAIFFISSKPSSADLNILFDNKKGIILYLGIILLISLRGFHYV